MQRQYQRFQTKTWANSRGNDPLGGKVLVEIDPSIGGSLRTERAKNASFCSYVRKISMQGRVCLLNSNVIDIVERNFLTMDLDILQVASLL